MHAAEGAHLFDHFFTLLFAMSHYAQYGLFGALLFCTLVCVTLGWPASSSSSASTASSSSIFDSMWSQLQYLLMSDVGFALLVLPFSVSAFPLAYLLLRTSSPKSVHNAMPSSAPSLPPASATPAPSSPSLPRYSSTSSPLTPLLPITHFTPAPSPHSHSDVLVIGSGIAGSTLSILLARLGLTVTTVERDLSIPHRIVGELLQPGGCRTLDALGLGEALGGFDEQVIEGYTILMPGKAPLKLEYPQRAAGEDGGKAGEREEGRSFHHGRFVMSLRARVQREPRCTLLQGDVTRLLMDEADGGRVTGAQYSVSRDGRVEERSHRAALTVVADGCLSSFRRQLSTQSHAKLSSFLGLVLHDCPLPTPHHGHVLLAEPTPILAYPISSTEVRMLIDYPNGSLPATPAATKSDLLLRVAPQLPDGMRPSFLRAVSDGRWSSMPNQSLPCRPKPISGVLMMGDAVNMRHPLTGGGMTVAIKDCDTFVRLLTSRLALDLNSRVLDAVVLDYYAQRTEPVRVINILADALYAVFSAQYGALRTSCFDYLSEGEAYSGGPVKLLSGVATNQWLLVYHFFSVAVYGAVKAVWPWQGVGKVKECAGMLRDACAIIVPLLEAQNGGVVKLLFTTFRALTRI